MRKWIGSAVLAALLATLPGFAAAQRRAAMESGPQHELGVDFSFEYLSLGSGGGSGVQLAAPVDVRVGFLSRSTTMFEGRFSMLWDSNSGFLTLEPGVNVLHELKKGSGTHGLMHGTYVTGGVGLDILKPGSAASSTTQFALNGGIGERLPYESAVFRPEAFVAYAFKTSTVPSAFSLGVRFGLSFWH